MEPEHFPEASTIVAQGEPGRYFYIVERGQVQFVVDGKIKGTQDACSSFGELALIYSSPRMATVVATEPTDVWKITRDAFRYSMADAAKRRHTETVTTLQTVPILMGLNSTQISLLADAVHYQTFSTNQVIIKKGEVGELFYFIKEGEVLCNHAGENYSDRVLTPGQCFGERSLITGDLTAADVSVSAGPCV